MKRPIRAVVLGLVLGACGFNGNYRDTAVPMASVATLDVARYQGLWHEIARFPNGFEKDCTNVTAEYGPAPGGRISVRNSCRKGAPDGPLKVAEGTARVAAPGRLKVKFVQWLPLEGDYWVLYLDPDYTLAVVGEPSGDFGWILARARVLTADQRAAALAALAANGYDTTRLLWTVHAP